MRSDLPTVVRCLPALLLAVLLLPFAACSTADDGGGNAVIKSIALSLTSPKADEIRKGIVKIEGKATPDDGVTDVEVVCTIKGIEVGRVKGTSFSFDWDTKALDPKMGKEAFKDGKIAIALTATGSSGASGTLARTITVDNTPPAVTIATPTPGEVRIGSLNVTGSINDKNIALARVYLDNETTPYLDWCNNKAAKGAPDACDTCEAKSPSGKCLSGNGPFSFVLDRTGKPTADVTIRVAVADWTQTQTIEQVTAKVLKAPDFEVVKHHEDPATGAQFALETGDVNGDGVVDAMIAAENGAFVRYGVNVGTKDNPKGTGAFGPAQPLAQDGPCSHVIRVEIDGDGALDYVFVGEAEGGSQAVAVLSRPGGPRVVEKRKFPGITGAVAKGDIDGDGVEDVVIGGKETNHALTIMRLLTTAICPSKEKADRACKDATDGATIQGGLVFDAALQKLQFTGGVTAVQVGDFFSTGSSAGQPDIALGRGDQALLTTCRNVDGKIGNCIDTPTNSWVADLTDTALLAQYDWNLDGRPDLIVGSRGAGVVRWLAGEGDGTFTYKPNSYRMYITKVVDSISIHPIGPSDTDYLILLANGRTATLIPVNPQDKSHVDKCYRTFILGGAVGAVAPADLDNDGWIDMVTMDNAPLGLSVARGTGDGNFEAAVVSRVCGGLPGTVGFFGHLEVADFILDDINADGKPDALLLSKDGTSLQPDAFCPEPLGGTAAWHMHLYLNESGKLTEYPRSAEISPFTSSSAASQAGITADPATAKCASSIEEVVGFATGEFGGGPTRDLAIALKREYTPGAAPDPKILAELNKNGDYDPLTSPNLGCEFREFYEVVNYFGETIPDGVEPGSAQSCKNFSDKKPGEGEKPKPLIGYGQGAPWARASLLIFGGGVAAAPLGMGADGKPGKPSEIKPVFAQAAGIGAIGMTVGRFDNDNFDDIAMVMPFWGDKTTDVYLHDRVRFFRSTGDGKVRSVLFTSEADKEAGKIGADQQVDNAAIEFITVANKSEQSSWPKLDPNTGLYLKDVYTTYRTLGHTPTAVQSANYCTDPLDSIFTIGPEMGNILSMRATGGMKFQQGEQFPGEVGFTAFDVRSFETEDACTDVLYATPQSLGFFRGDTDGLFGNSLVPSQTKDVVAVTSADVNEDGLIDVLLVDQAKSAVDIYLGDGAGKFYRVPRGLLAMPVGNKIRQADINGDGCVEIAVQGTYGVAIFRNLGCK